jgi:hypothetical protein
MSTATSEIPHDLWQACLHSLVERYVGWRLTVDVLSMEIGSHRAVDGLALVGLSLETKGSDAGDILIEAGDMAAALMIHHVDHPRCVRVAATLPGLEIDIQIESEDGTTTILVLRRRPELPPASSALQQMPESGSVESDAPMHCPPRVRPSSFFAAHRVEGREVICNGSI